MLSLKPENTLPNSNFAKVEKALKLSHHRWILLGLATLSIVSTLFALGLGAAVIAPDRVAQIVGHHLFNSPSNISWSLGEDAIIWQVRTPRVLLGAVVGATLATSGLVLQAITRNPLAEPHILGVSSGASTGAALAILFGFGASLGGHSITIMAFAGALASMLLVLSLARVGGAITPGKMLVSGVAVSYLLNAFTSLLVMFNDSEQGARSVMFWLMGSLGRADWATLPAITFISSAGIFLMWWWRRRLDLLTIGDDSTRASGVDPERTRLVLIVVVSLCVAASVAASGGIGFLGLAVPHFARRFLGATHRAAVPATAILGALLLVWADVLARMLIRPGEMPIGVITAISGAPILVILVRRLQTS